MASKPIAEIAWDALVGQIEKFYVDLGTQDYVIDTYDFSDEDMEEFWEYYESFQMKLERVHALAFLGEE